MGFAVSSLLNRVRGCFLVTCLLVIVLIVTVLQTLSNTVTEKEKACGANQLYCGKEYIGKKELRNISILCLILSSAVGTDKMAAVNKTWARRCDKYFFVYGRTNKSQKDENILYVPVPESRAHLTAKVRYALQYVYQTYNNNFDWILKSDDDTYIIVENLRYLLSQADPKKPGYLGFHMKNQKSWRNGYMSGGAGYAISSGALHLLIHIGFQDINFEDGFDEDQKIGLCLAKSDVPVLGSLDTQGRETFHPDSLQRHLYPPHPKWLYTHAWNQVPKFGSKCCSKYSISFHYVSPGQIFLYDQLLYNTEVYGLKKDNEDKHPVFHPQIVEPATDP